MTRPYLSASIDILEDALETAIETGDRSTIEAIAHELTHRRVPRAKDLADRISGLQTPLPGMEIPRQTRPASAAPARPSSNSGSRPGAKPKGPPPTPQQEEAINAFQTQGSLRINAYAGSGKTSTLQMLAHSTGRRGQYIAFNRAIVTDAKQRFPDTVDCSTTHGLAFRATPQAYRQNMQKMTGRVSSQQLADILGLKKLWRIDENHTLQPRSQAFLILETVKRYAQSGDDEIADSHVPRHGSLSTAGAETLAKVTDFARRGAIHVWGRMCAPEDEIPLGHDGYLKLWALSRPRIAADFILLDEAQDTNPVVLEVLKLQQAQLVYVGDRYQQIYEWRGAVNAMEAIQTDHSAQLTQSFRFGPDIATAASKVLSMLGETSPLVGNGKLSSIVGHCIPDTILARTNANVMTALVDALNDGRSPHLVGGTSELMEMLRGVQDLKDGNPSNVPDFFGFQNWQEVVDFSKTQEGEALVTFVNLVESRGERQLMWALGRAVEEDKADLVLSTAHKAKGREWDNVRLMDDFLKSRPAPKDRPEDQEKRDRDYAAELRLFYVALTRARRAVDVPQALAETLGITVAPKPIVEPAKPIIRPVQSPTPAAAQATPSWSPPKDWKRPATEPAPIKTEAKKPAARGFLARLFGL
jgi:hypothetical protein